MAFCETDFDGKVAKLMAALVEVPARAFLFPFLTTVTQELLFSWGMRKYSMAEWVDF